MFEGDQQTDVSGRNIIKFFVIGILLVLISDIPNNLGVVYYIAEGIILSLLIISLIFPVKIGLPILFLVAIAGQDIVSSADISNSYSTASIWQMRFGPIRPSWLVFSCLFVHLMRLGRLNFPPLLRINAIWFATIPIITGLAYGGIFSNHALVEVIKDLKMPIMLISSGTIFYTLLKRNPWLFYQLSAALVGVLIARHLADLIHFMMNFGPVIAENISRGSEDSAKGGVVFLVFFGLFVAWKLRRFLIGNVISVLAVLLLAAYGSRMLWVTFFIGMLSLFSILKFRQSIVFGVLGVLIVVMGSFGLAKFNPESAAIVLARSKTITEGRDFRKFAVSTDYNALSRIDPIRYAEIVNIWHGAYKRLAYLWGTGYGGFYEDEVIDFPNDLASSFPQYSLDEGIFYGAHGFIVHVFLKHGFIGLALISSLWILPGFKMFKIFRGNNMFKSGDPILLHCIMFSLLPFLFTAMLQLYWSGKGLFINGAILALIFHFLYRNNEGKNQSMRVVSS